MDLAHDLFFLQSEDQVSETQIVVRNKSEYQHIAKSLRMAVGDGICLSDGRDFVYSAAIVQIDSKQVVCKISERQSLNKSAHTVHLHPAILKGSTFDLLLEKAIELGADEIHPTITQHCIAAKDKQEKWQNTVLKAQKQCKRPRLVSVSPAQSLEKTAASGCLVVPELEVTATEISEIDLRSHSEIHLFIGPEGGFSQTEIEWFKTKGAKFATLGRQRLRAETAAWKSLILIDEKLKETR